MKACRFCAEEIQDAAIICKHCHADLVKDVPAGARQTIIVESHKFSPGSFTGGHAAAPQGPKWKPLAWVGAALAVLVVTPILAKPQPRAPSAPIPIPALVVTIRPSAAGGWRVINDSSLNRSNCSLSIEGHSVNIVTLPNDAAVELAATAFSDGGIPHATPVSKAEVSMFCQLPDRQVASVRLFQSGNESVTQ
jgi:hypothetical protein